jgi:hypothetical protein
MAKEKIYYVYIVARVLLLNFSFFFARSFG